MWCSKDYVNAVRLIDMLFIYGVVSEAVYIYNGWLTQMCTIMLAITIFSSQI